MNSRTPWRNPQGKGMRVEVVDREQAMVMRAEDGGWVWAFVLVPEGAGTRFLSRNRFRLTEGLLSRLASTYLMEPGSLVMERKMLLGIKERAEHLARERIGDARLVDVPPSADAVVVEPTGRAPDSPPAPIDERELAIAQT